MRMPGAVSLPAVIDGDVTSDGPVDVLGKIVGSASAPEVVVAATGRIEGTVSAHDLFVLGFVSGSVSARHVQLSLSAVVNADVLHERVVIEAGAVLERPAAANAVMRVQAPLPRLWGGSTRL